MHRHLQLVWQQLLCGSRGMADYKLLIPIVCLCHLCQLRHEKESEEKSLLWQFDLTVFGFSCGCSSNMSCTYATMCTLCAGDASTPFERDICEKLASGVFWLKVFKLALRCELFVFVSTDSTTGMMCTKYIAGDKRERCYEISQGNPQGPHAHALCYCMLYIYYCVCISYVSFQVCPTTLFRNHRETPVNLLPSLLPTLLAMNRVISFATILFHWSPDKALAQFFFQYFPSFLKIEDLGGVWF